MLILGSTADVLKLITDAANNIDVHASYIDFSAATQTPGRTNTAVTTATTTTILGAPAVGVFRVLKHLSAINKSSAGALDNVTLQHTNGTTAVELVKFGLNGGDQLLFTDRGAFGVFEPGGRDKGRYMFSPQMPAVALPPGAVMNNAVTGELVPSNSSIYATYIGKAPFDLSAMTVLWRQSTLAATITFAELSIATGPFDLSGAWPRFKFKAFADISGKITTTGLKTQQITGLGIKEGEPIWICFGQSATTAGGVRIYTFTDDLVADLATTSFFARNTDGIRASQVLGTERAFSASVAGGTNTIWFAAKYS